MNHNRRKFEPTALMPMPPCRTQTRYEFGKGQTIEHPMRLTRKDGSTVDMTRREFKRLREMTKYMRRKTRRIAKKETTT
jgi:hypothetical protein